MPKEENAITVSRLTKSFKLPHEQSSGLKQHTVNFFSRNKGYEIQTVLDDVSFEINKGDFFGIVGLNGSGKSTLLKTLAGIYSPDSGSTIINGSLVPFIELGVGFNPELTGRENVYLNGALLGFSHSEMESMYEDIVDFAELKRFMDQKLKNYSSGMQVRLAFSIAIRADADILLLDEVLAVGDEAFQKKCYAYFAELKKNKKTVVLVTHSMESVQRFCTKAMLLNNGKIVDYGSPSTIAGKYLELNNPALDSKKRTSETGVGNKLISASVDLNSSPDKLVFDIKIKSTIVVDDPVVAVLINNEAGDAVYRWASDDTSNNNLGFSPDKVIKIKLELDNIFPDGKFDLQLAIKNKDRSEVYALYNEILIFELINDDMKKRNIHWKPKEIVSYE